MSQVIAELNQKIVDESIQYLVTAATDRADESDVIRMVANIVECTGGYLDACSLCGAMPMTTNCNNAGCDK